MNETIKVATIPIILLVAMIVSAILLTTGVEGALAISWVSMTITAVSGYVIGRAVPAIYKGYKTFRKGK